MNFITITTIVIICILIVISISVFSLDYYIEQNDTEKMILGNISDNYGLGNQLFVTASSYGLAKKNNMNHFITKCKNNFHDKQDYSKNILKHFNIYNEKFNSHTIVEPPHKFSNEYISSIKRTSKLDGYFQNEKYFKQYKSEIIKKFKDNAVYKNVVKQYSNKFRDCFFIHIRMGDYNKESSIHYIDLNLYYKTVLFHLKQLYGNNIKFCLFSDEIEKCKKLPFLTDVNLIYITETNPVKTLYMMSLCEKGGICPNSTFSWWGSYLNENNKKFVSFPHPWIKNYKDIDIYYENSQIFPVKYPVTCVSGYWKVKNKHDNKYSNWFEKTLNINCPFVIFGDKQSIEYLKPFRKKYPTHYIELNIQDFEMYKYKSKIMTHPIHCPSKELSMIWNQKIYLIKKAKDLNMFESKFYCWYDAGMAVYRDKYPSQKILGDSIIIENLPTDKLIYTSSARFNKNMLKDIWYHHITGTYILHKKIIDMCCKLYTKHLDSSTKITTDQVVLTHIYNKHPEFFYKIDSGYCKIVELLLN